MSEWIGELTGALADEYGDKPYVCTFATVDKSGAPRARSVVCRKFNPDGSVCVTTDARSEKNEHVRLVPQAELVFWLPNRREQFRLLGSVKLVAGGSKDPLLAELWNNLTDASRALFFWPSPGARRVDAPEAFATGVPAEKPAPANFEVLVVRPRRVEQLQLSPHPHRRRRWMLAGNWSAAAEVNP